MRIFHRMSVPRITALATLATAFGAGLVAAASAARVAGAQVASVDEGRFALMIAGERVGREEFSIRSAPSASGIILVAQGTVVLSGRYLKPGLNTDTSGAVLRYQNEVRSDGRVEEAYSGQATRDHYAARSQREDGESLREFRLPPGTVVVDDQICHQLWFVARRGPGARVRVLAPRRNVVETIAVELVGSETLAIDVQEFAVRHLRLRTEETGATRDVWLDTRGRLLKVVVPADRLVAVREDVR